MYDLPQASTRVAAVGSKPPTDHAVGRWVLSRLCDGCHRACLGIYLGGAILILEISLVVCRQEWSWILTALLASPGVLGFIILGWFGRPDWLTGEAVFSAFVLLLLTDAVAARGSGC
jgi:hypothetical protein